jgi:hypothetical protein
VLLSAVSNSRLLDALYRHVTFPALPAQSLGIHLNIDVCWQPPSPVCNKSRGGHQPTAALHRSHTSNEVPLTSKVCYGIPALSFRASLTNTYTRLGRLIYTVAMRFVNQIRGKSNVCTLVHRGDTCFSSQMLWPRYLSRYRAKRANSRAHRQDSTISDLPSQKKPCKHHIGCLA